MEKKPELPRSNLGRPIAAASAAIGGGGGDSNLNLTSSTSSSSSLSISPPDFLSQVNAVFKRHRPLGTMQNFSGANRVLVRQAEPSRNSTEPSNNSTSTTSVAGKKLPQTVGKRGTERFLNIGFDKRKDNELQVRSNTLEDSSLNTPSITGTVTNLGNGIDPIRMQQGEGEVLIDREKPCLPASSSHLLYSMVSSNDNSKKSADNSVFFQKGEGQFVNQVRGNNEDLKQHDPLNMEIYGNNGSHMMEKITDLSHNNQIMHPMTHSSVVGSSHQSTTMSVHSGPTYQCTHAPSAAHTEFPIQKLSSENNLSGVLSHIVTEGQEPIMIEGEDIREKVFSSNASHLQSQVLAPIHKSSNADVEPSQPSKAEKAPRKKKYDPDVFFKVNGKLYQKLGKIGSGGSSEVHKVITSDCTIYALKKIKLKGRDYPTAYGFCQEIKYLNRLKGKSNIIQLIDYEVTDKTLLQEVLDGSMTIKDGRIKDDQYIYMVLEYGEIDLAHMLSQKLKEAESSSLKIDDNWLRFYWQQMLEAVNTIHEERIVHSDLKPANFMLVRGSLKLIDFGIAKAILSDTTNIQRDAQVGTLNYMSPEAFTFNEADTSTNANTIKLGRPSDIWSLGCILYQMVYGTTPFSQYKTFWNKYKAITDKNHEITYEPISNPLLIDLMKRCLAWDRNERWRIPQLLQHQFLTPRVSRDWSVLERISLHSSDPEVNRLWEELGRVVDELERENKEQF